jgi:hypothetical protein
MASVTTDDCQPPFKRPGCRWPERVIAVYEDKRYHFRPELFGGRSRNALERLERLEQSEQLEQLYEIKSGRGRKSMGAKERKAVSERMTRYWQAWRVRHPHTDDAAS